MAFYAEHIGHLCGRGEKKLDLTIPAGLSVTEEYFYLRREQAKARKQPTIDYLFSLREWITKADLTFPNMAAPERAEKCVRMWLRAAAPGSWAIVGYERQERGAVHAHVVLDVALDKSYASALWNYHAGFCRIAKIRNGMAAIKYAVKHAIKDGDFDLFEPGATCKPYTTGRQKFLMTLGETRPPARS